MTNGVKLMLRRIGSVTWAEFHLPTTQLLIQEQIWPAAIELKSKLRDAWDLSRLSKQPCVKTSFEKPSLADFLMFAFDSGNTESFRFCQPLAQSLMAQICFAVDGNVKALGVAREVDAKSGFRNQAQCQNFRQLEAEKAALRQRRL